MSSNTSFKSAASKSGFVMPLVPPSKEDWVKDDKVQECMVCDTIRFSLLNRRHHCRRCGRVVCSNCSQRSLIIDESGVAKRTCDDCCKQIEMTSSSWTSDGEAGKGTQKHENEMNGAVENLASGTFF
jgi:hypothetical protein